MQSEWRPVGVTAFGRRDLPDGDSLPAVKGSNHGTARSPGRDFGHSPATGPRRALSRLSHGAGGAVGRVGFCRRRRAGALAAGSAGRIGPLSGALDVRGLAEPGDLPGRHLAALSPFDRVATAGNHSAGPGAVLSLPGGRRIADRGGGPVGARGGLDAARAVGDPVRFGAFCFRSLVAASDFWRGGVFSGRRIVCPLRGWRRAALSPWTMPLLFGTGQLLTAAVLLLAEREPAGGGP